MDGVVLVNIGNTTTEFAVWRHGKLHDVTRFSTAQFAAAIPDALRGLTDQRWLVACVVPALQCNSWLVELGVVWLQPTHATTVDLTAIDTNTIGADRLANAIAAVHMLSLPAIILDCGTAITTEVIDRQGRLLGGAIAPGRTMARHALCRATAQLPDVPLRAELTSAIGRNTADAIAAGVDLGCIGAVERLLADARAGVSASDLMATAVGGDSAFFVQFVDQVVAGPSHFTLHGLGVVAETL